MTGEQEPNGWELLRAIRDINTTLTSFASSYVSLAVFATLVERVKSAEDDLDTERTNRERDVSGLRKELDDARKAKNQLWTGLAVTAAGGLVTILVLVFNRGLGLQ